MTDTGTWYREFNPSNGRSVGQSHFSRGKDFTTLCGFELGDTLTSVGVDERVCDVCLVARLEEIGVSGIRDLTQDVDLYNRAIAEARRPV